MKTPRPVANNCCLLPAFVLTGDTSSSMFSLHSCHSNQCGQSIRQLQHREWSRVVGAHKQATQGQSWVNQHTNPSWCKWAVAAIPNVTATGKSYIQECSTNTIILALQMKINREVNCKSVYFQISLNMDVSNVVFFKLQIVYINPNKGVVHSNCSTLHKQYSVFAEKKQ